MKGVKCPICKYCFYVGGHIPKWTICDMCGTQFVVERHRTKVRDFIEKLTRKGRV